MPESFESSLLPSADDLDKAVAEQELKTRLPAEPITPSAPRPADISVNILNNNEGKCFKCGEAAINFCKHCGQEFCSEHKSKYTNGICCLCITTDNLGLEFEKLVDEEPDEQGIMHTHRGRRIKLIGEGWPNAMQLIETLTDEGLEIFIAERQRLLKEAVALGEYHRITLAAAEFTKEHNRRSKAARLRRRREELQKQGSVRLGGKSVTMGASSTQRSSKKTSEEKLAASLGLTMEQFQAFKKLVAKP